MDRRHFIKASLSAASLAAAYPLGAAPMSPAPQRWLSHIYLDGGPDFRHLILPDRSTEMGRAYWLHRREAWGFANAFQVHAFLDGLTWEVTSQGPMAFHPAAGWLAQQWRLGNVAVINNVLGSSSRNHELATVVMQSADAGATSRAASGWGGRLAHHLGGNAVSLTQRVRQFCFGPGATSREHDNSKVLSIREMRQFGLYRPEQLDENPAHRGYRLSLYRALHSYYQGASFPEAYGAPKRHFEKLSVQGAQIRERLSGVSEDAGLKALMDGTDTCHHRGFARQCNNLLEAASCRDILRSSVFSLNYGGFDTHRDQGSRLTERFYDLFNEEGCLSRCQSSLQGQHEEQADGLVWMIHGEFGRQLAANGDGGKDHGRGGSVILVGNSVRGGFYGEFLPEAELPRYEENNSDILGLTHMEEVIGRVCDGISMGSSASVLQNPRASMVESGVDLQLF